MHELLNIRGKTCLPLLEKYQEVYVTNSLTITTLGVHLSYLAMHEADCLVNTKRPGYSSVNQCDGIGKLQVAYIIYQLMTKSLKHTINLLEGSCFLSNMFFRIPFLLATLVDG